jgi:hypothetical protein
VVVEPDRLDRLDDLFPDSRAKAEAHAKGRALVALPVLGSAAAKEADQERE